MALRAAGSFPADEMKTSGVDDSGGILTTRLKRGAFTAEAQKNLTPSREDRRVSCRIRLP